LLAVGIGHPGSLTWLHRDCVPAWHAARIAAAVAALGAMNIVASAGAPIISEETTSASAGKNSTGQIGGED